MLNQALRLQRNQKGKFLLLTFGDQPAVEEIVVDPTATVDPAVDDTVDPIVTPPLSLRAIMETFMTT